MEDYKKKYEDLITSLKKAKEDEMVRDDRFCVVIDNIVPKLKESEDERIMKRIVLCLEECVHNDIIRDYEKNECLAWLEKQKPIELDKDVEIRFRSILNLIDNGCPIEKSYIDFIKSVYVMLMKSQQQKTSENDYLKKQGEQKPAWSEEDDKKRKGLIKGLEDRMGFGWASDPFSREEYIDWLKSLKDRVQLQPKKEWSEEDENMFKSILNDIETMRNNATVEQYIDVCNNKIDWFKSLKDKVRLSIDEKSIPLKEFVLNVWMLGNEWKDITKGIFDTEHGTQLEYVLKHWKEGEYYLRAKQDELKPVEESWPNLSNCLHDCKNCTGRCIYRKEEYQNQKPTDKVEPKFHEGDWVVQGCNILKIRCVGNEYYCFETVGGHIDDMLVSEIDSLYRLWTIQDAKDGDVLYMDNGLSTCTFIYETINNRIIQKYASYNKFGFEGRHYLILNDGYVCPATKEQCDLLFQKMKEAGYEWDGEKKELKKIEQKTTWSEEDGEMLRRCISATFDHGYLKECDWLKSLKDRVQPQPKKEWSKEDSERLLRIHQFIWANRKGDTDEIYQQEQDADWIMSLNPQQNNYDKGYNDGYSAAKYNQWKPKKEELEALRKRTYFCEGIDANLDSLYTNLLKL